MTVSFVFLQSQTSLSAIKQDSDVDIKNVDVCIQFQFALSRNVWPLFWNCFTFFCNATCNIRTKAPRQKILRCI